MSLRLVLITFRPGKCKTDVEDMYSRFDEWMKNRCDKSILVKEQNPKCDGYHLHGLYLYKTKQKNFASLEKGLILSAARSRIQKKYEHENMNWASAFDVQVDKAKVKTSKENMTNYLFKQVSENDVIIRKEFDVNEFNEPVHLSFAQLLEYNNHVIDPKWYYMWDNDPVVLQHAYRFLDSEEDVTGVTWDEWELLEKRVVMPEFKKMKVIPMEMSDMYLAWRRKEELYRKMFK